MPIRRLLLSGAALLGLVGCGGGGTTTTTTGASAAPTRDLFTVLASDSTFDRFVDAINRSNADEMLRGPGIFTVFAPTSSGWGDIPISVRDATFPANGPADPVRGRALINAHIVEGRHPLSEFVGKKTTLTTVNGNRVIVDGADPNRVTVESDGGGGYSAGGGRLFYGSSTITRGDIEAVNGLVHVVNKAVLP
jgi:uncharacterized surface protein with fasciclin (FAS1) repeats